VEKRLTKAVAPVRLTFLPDGFTVTASPGDTILDAALEHDVGLEHECGGNCACTTCHVYVLDGEERLSPPEEVEIDRLSTDERLQSNSRLGCQAILLGGDVIVQLLPME
jgi:2Fe-2S ferredoxin